MERPAAREILLGYRNVQQIEYFVQVMKNRVLDHPHHTGFPQVEERSLSLLWMGDGDGGVIILESVRKDTMNLPV